MTRTHAQVATISELDAGTDHAPYEKLPRKVFTAQADDLSTLIMISREGDVRLRLDGWISSSLAWEVALVWSSGSQVVPVTAEGRFSVPDAVSGQVWLEFVAVDTASDAGARVRTPTFEIA
jgi:hypothetical protein